MTEQCPTVVADGVYHGDIGDPVADVLVEHQRVGGRQRRLDEFGGNAGEDRGVASAAICAFRRGTEPRRG